MPSFQVLGEYVFQGEGEPEAVVKAFVNTYEGYQKARELTTAAFGSSKVSLEAGQALCTPDGGEFGEDDLQMEAAWHMAKQTGMLPPPLMDMLPDFIMEMNHFFIAAQNLQRDMDSVQKLWGIVVTKCICDPEEYEFLAATELDDDAYGAIASLIADGDAFSWAVNCLRENLTAEALQSSGECSVKLNIGPESFVIEAAQFELDGNPREFTDDVDNIAFTDRPLKKGDDVYMWVDVNEIGGIFSACVDSDMCVPLKLV